MIEHHTEHFFRPVIGLSHQKVGRMQPRIARQAGWGLFELRKSLRARWLEQGLDMGLRRIAVICCGGDTIEMQAILFLQPFVCRCIDRNAECTDRPPRAAPKKSISPQQEPVPSSSASVASARDSEPLSSGADLLQQQARFGSQPSRRPGIAIGQFTEAMAASAPSRELVPPLPLHTAPELQHQLAQFTDSADLTIPVSVEDTIDKRIAWPSSRQSQLYMHGANSTLGSATTLPQWSDPLRWFQPGAASLSATAPTSTHPRAESLYSGMGGADGLSPMVRDIPLGRVTSKMQVPSQQAPRPTGQFPSIPQALSTMVTMPGMAGQSWGPSPALSGFYAWPTGTPPPHGQAPYRS